MKKIPKIYDNENDDMIVVPSLVNKLNKNAENYRKLWMQELKEINKLKKQISYLQRNWNEACEKVKELEQQIEWNCK